MNNLPACFQEQKLKEQRTLNLRCWTRWLLIQNGKMHGWLLLDEAEMDVGCLDCLCEMTLHRCAELSPWQHSVFHLRYWQSWGLGNCINSWQPGTSRHLGYLNSLGLLEDYNSSCVSLRWNSVLGLSSGWGAVLQRGRKGVSRLLSGPQIRSWITGSCLSALVGWTPIFCSSSLQLTFSYGWVTPLWNLQHQLSRAGSNTEET